MIRSARWIAPLLILAASASAVAEGETVARRLTSDDIDSIEWRSVGPANMGGRVSSIALVPGSRTIFYVGFATGGIFKTENMGVTLEPVFDKYGMQSIGSLAVADAGEDWRGWADEDEEGEGKDRVERGKGKIVWVGTGEGNGRNSSSWGNGVYRSTDAGASFTHLGLEETHDIPALAVDPRDPDVCYVAALGHLWGANPERGVFKTTDGGKSWEHVLAVDDKTGASDVVVDAAHPDTVYAALYARRRTPWSFAGNSESGGIFRSDDGGATWKKLAAGLPPRTGRIGLTLFPKDTRVVYAVIESDYGGSGRDPFENRSPSGGVFRSEDRGETWERMSDLSPRPFYFSRIAIDPEDRSRVYLPGWDLAISDDGGKTFRRSGSRNVHVDFHAIVVNPVDSNQIIVGNDGGVYISHDRAKTWDYLNHVAAGQFYRIDVDMSDPYRIAGGLQDNGSWLGPSETVWETEDEHKAGILSKDWETVGWGDGFTVAFDPLDPNRVYTTSQGGYLVRTQLDNMVRRLLRPAADEGEQRLRFNWDAPFLVSQHDPTVLYHAGNRVYKLKERGDKWFAISGDLSRNEPGKTDTVGSDAETYGTVVTLAESALQRGLLWAGTDDGLIHVTANDGESWDDVTPREVGGLYVSRIRASVHDADRAYAAIDGHRSDVFRPIVLMTGDRGRSWKNIAGDLPPKGPVIVVVEDPENPDVLYAGTEFGCFATVDRGVHWLRLNGESLPPVAVDDLVVHPRELDLVAGTHGRSVWILDDISFISQLTPEVRQRPLALLKPQPGKPRQRMGRAYGNADGFFRAKNPPLGAMLHFWVREAAGESFKLSIENADGVELRELKGVTRLGVNRVVWDLQADEKHVFEGPDEDWSAGQRLFVAPGTYTARLTVGEEKDETTVEVLEAPQKRP